MKAIQEALEDVDEFDGSELDEMFNTLDSRPEELRMRQTDDGRILATSSRSGPTAVIETVEGRLEVSYEEMSQGSELEETWRDASIVQVMGSESTVQD